MAQPCIPSELWVVETCEGDAFLGRIVIDVGEIRVYSGYRGHPVTVPADQVERLVRAEEHPDVEVLA